MADNRTFVLLLGRVVLARVVHRKARCRACHEHSRSQLRGGKGCSGQLFGAGTEAVIRPQIEIDPVRRSANRSGGIVRGVASRL